jgi:glycosyltransferase involved in cell wall biosynthesis
MATSKGPAMRLAVLAPGEIFGGAERQVLTLVQGLVAHGGAEPTLILFHDGELAQRAREQRIQVHVLGAQRLLDRESITALRRLLRDRTIEVVSVHGYRASAYLALAASGKRIGVVKTEHGRTEVPHGGWLTRMRPILYRRLEILATRQLRARVVYVTQDLRSRCTNEYRTLSGSVIYNGILPLDAHSAEVPAEFKAHAINLVALGRLEPVKGLDFAIAAMAHPTMPSEAHLHIIGDGPERSSLAELASKYDVADRVSFHGFRSNVYDYLAHSDAAVMPSLHEGLPYTLLESLSAGTPVIASRVGGLAEVLSNGETAMLVEPRDSMAIADAVRQLVENPRLRHRLASSGHALLSARFTADAMVRHYMSEFETARRLV